MSARISSKAMILSSRARSTFRILPFSGKMAWKRRSRPCLAEPPAESPSTRNNSHRLGSFSVQSASSRGDQAFFDDAPTVARVFGQELIQTRVDDRLDRWTDLGIVELVLRLRLE